ncbi:MAG: 4Fe-4S dicluster domain-containing protein [Gammaproteobacteria bacterium]|nr:4Fe-4S dicluster domain-containing protein [Gammaproteobacteria bacterium]MDH5801589.1 4Fe-4S dicluster domain-containing protein [Gammaproteobacteria bacterium]
MDGPSLNNLQIRSDNQYVCIDCCKVPPELSPPGSLRVPCLGSISLSDLLYLSIQAEGRPLLILDRNWCSDCPASKDGNNPVHSVLLEAKAWLSDLFVPQDEQPLLVLKPLPRHRRRNHIPKARNEAGMSRRAFFDQLAGEAIMAVQFAVEQLSTQEFQEVSKADSRRHSLRATERERLYNLLNTIATQRGQSIPARFFPHAEIDAQSCRNHRHCVALCPTKALRTYELEGVVGVDLDPVACIACGQCEHICPERAFKFFAAGIGVVSQAGKRLSQHRCRVCDCCGREYCDNVDEPTCMRCRQSQKFVTEAYRTIFGAQLN